VLLGIRATGVVIPKAKSDSGYGNIPCFSFRLSQLVELMCCRYSITKELSELEKLVKIICRVVDFKPRFKPTATLFCADSKKSQSNYVL